MIFNVKNGGILRNDSPPQPLVDVQGPFLCPLKFRYSSNCGLFTCLRYVQQSRDGGALYPSWPSATSGGSVMFSSNLVFSQWDQVIKTR